LKKAIVSCSDKRGLVDFCRKITDIFEIYSTEGTSIVLRKNGLEVKPVSDLTGFPEILGGRVKTLHPKLLGGILARGEADSQDILTYGLTPIDLVLVNLYPFMQIVSKDHEFSEAIENIDIGGVTLIRAAAKNFMNVIVVIDPSDYDWVADSINKGSLSYSDRLTLASKAFDYTARYDSSITKYLQSQYLQSHKPPSS